MHMAHVQLYDRIVRAIVSSLKSESAVRSRALKALSSIVEVDSSLLADV
jgi:hypothetical protein